MNNTNSNNTPPVATPVTSLNNEQLQMSLVQLAIQQVALQQSQQVLVTELVRRQVEQQQATESTIISPKLRQMRPDTGSFNDVYNK